MQRPQQRRGLWFCSTNPSAADGVGRPGTPVVNGNAKAAEVAATTAPVGPGSSFEASLIDSIEIDLGDF